MKTLFIEIPTWLGDCIMTTPAIENIIKTYPYIEITIFGSSVATNVFKYHPNVKKVIIDTSKNQRLRYVNLYKLVKNLPNFDIAISFRRNLSTKLLLSFIKAKHKQHYQRYTKKQIHQVIRYNDFINLCFNLNTTAQNLKIFLQRTPKKKNILGINPGATYGSAKRWYPDKFAEVINQIATNFDEVLIFGGKNEENIASDIVKNLKINNSKNLAGKLSVIELIEHIASLQTFITADSGPMHIASAFNIQTIALFGPTKSLETSPWNNTNATIIRQNLENLDCAPCMQRKCQKKHHKCMQNINPSMVIEKI